MQSLIIAFAMYSRIPMPRADWNDKNMRYAFLVPRYWAGDRIGDWCCFLYTDRVAGGICFPGSA